MPTVRHSHVPIFRVARAGWKNPLDTTFSRQQSNRWNVRGGIPVLYTCCSEQVARAIVSDIFGFASLDLEDLNPDVRPVLLELSRQGEAVDMASAAGILECGFPLTYPEQIGHLLTQPFAQAWYALGAEAILCRSASVLRTTHQGWMGSHLRWSELAIFGERGTPPILVRRRNDFEWLASELAPR